MDDRIPKKSGKHPLESNFPHPLHNTILIMSNDEMKDIIKIVKSLEDSGSLLNGVSEIIQNEDEE